MTDFEVFQAVRDAYLSRKGEIFGFACAVVKCRELGLSNFETQDVLRRVQLHLNAKRIQTVVLRDTGRELV